MPEMAAPRALAERSSGGRPPRPPASQSASPDAAIAMTHAGDDEWDRVLHVCARVQRGHSDVVHRDDAAAHGGCGDGQTQRVGGPALAVKIAAPTTSTQTRNDSSVGKTR